MSTSTTNYGLVKPAGGEQYARSVLNNNYDLIDAAIMSEAHKIQHLELVRQGHVAGTGVIGPGPLSGLVEAATSKNYSDWVSYPADDQLTITKEGIYTVSWKIVPNATVSFWHSISDVGNPAAGTVGRSQLVSVTASDAYWAIGPDLYVPPAGYTMAFKFSLGSAQTINHRIKITKVK